MRDVAYVYSSDSIYAIWKNRSFSKRTHYGVSILGSFQSWTCQQVSSHENLPGNLICAEL